MTRPVPTLLPRFVGACNRADLSIKIRHSQRAWTGLWAVDSWIPSNTAKVRPLSGDRFLMMAAAKQASSHFFCSNHHHICMHFDGLTKVRRKLSACPERVRQNEFRKMEFLNRCLIGSQERLDQSD
jgi:hypothetical protein